MIITSEFKDFVRADISRIEKILKDNISKDDLLNLHREIDGRYQSCIMNWNQGLNCVCYLKDSTSAINYVVLEDRKEKIKANLSLMKSKLETYIFGMNAVSLPEPQTTTVNVNTSVNLNVTFEQVRSQIEDMTSLTDEQTEEILNKISEIEATVNSIGTKKSKWEKIKPVLIWLADKSFDVAMTVLPLLLKVQN